MDTNTGESPGHQSQSQQLGNSPSEEEMRHWTPTGIEPTDYNECHKYATRILSSLRQDEGQPAEHDVVCIRILNSMQVRMVNQLNSLCVTILSSCVTILSSCVTILSSCMTILSSCMTIPPPELYIMLYH